MKRIYLIMVLCSLLIRSYSQWGYGHVNFDDTIGLNRISIDTSISNNVWQIGAPEKPFFKSARSLPNAIVTDTANPYPANSNSVFYYRTSGDYNTESHDIVLDFWYKMDCDTLNDFGKIEISLDTGLTWQSINSAYSGWYVYDSIYQLIQASYSSDDTIVFTGRTNGWYLFTWDVSVDMTIFDTVIYRFTFHSSNQPASRDGWMIDDIQFNTLWETISEKGKPYKIYPNPVKDKIIISTKASVSGYEIFNSLGCIVRRNDNFLVPMTVNVQDLLPGVYFIKIKYLNGLELMSKFVRI